MTVGSTASNQSVTTLFVKLDYLREGLGLPGPNRGTGGIETQVAQLVKSLAARDDFHVVVLTNEMFEYPGIEVRLDPAPLAPLTFSQRILRRLGFKVQHRAESEPWQKYSASSAGPKVTLFPKSLTADEIALAKSAGCKTMFWVAADSLIDDTPLNKSMPWVGETRDLLPEMDLVAVLTHNQQEILARNLGLPATVVTGGAEWHTASLGTPQQQFALWVGRPVPLKRPWVFVELAEALPQYSFRMVLRPAPSDAHMVDYLHFEAARLGNLELVFDVAAPDMAEQYLGAVALVSTSASEGLPRVMIEAGAVGTEVLSLEIDVDRMLSTDEWGFCANGETSALRDRLAELFSRGGSTTEERAAAREYVQERYGAHRMADEFVAAMGEFQVEG